MNVRAHVWRKWQGNAAEGEAENLPPSQNEQIELREMRSVSLPILFPGTHTGHLGGHWLGALQMAGFWRFENTFSFICLGNRPMQTYLKQINTEGHILKEKWGNYVIRKLGNEKKSLDRNASLLQAGHCWHECIWTATCHKLALHVWRCNTLTSLAPSILVAHQLVPLFLLSCYPQPDLVK